MVTQFTGTAAEQLEQLASDVVRLCHGKQAVLQCGRTVVARWGDEPGPTFVIAAQPFGAGSEAYELRLLDSAPRNLTPAEAGSFEALTEAIRRQLEFLGRQQDETNEAWIKYHVAVAVDYVTDSFVLLRSDWSIQHVNSQFERMVDLSKSDVVGRSLWEVLPQMLGTPFETEIRASMDGNLPRVFEQRSDVSDRWFQSRAFPCKDGLAILTIDITERKKEEAARAEFERRTVQAQRMESLGTLAGGIAHDFNNILGAILGHVGLLDAQLQPGSLGRESVEQIGIASRRARDLVQQILTFARAVTRELVSQPIRPMIEEAILLLRSTLPSATRINLVFADEPLVSTLNTTEVQQLVVNLGTNASHALQEGAGEINFHVGSVSIASPTKVRVGELAPGKYVELVVSDTGAGIKEATLSRLFEPFFTTKRRGEGTGLGLHVVRGIAAAHGGAIAVESQLGKGSVFRIYLPASEHADATAVTSMPRTQLLGRGERVVYVDDDEVVRLMVQRVLEHQGFTVTAFANPHHLIEAVGAHPHGFDLLVTDYSMPGMNGLDVARSVRSVRPDIPVIIATGYVAEDLRREVDALGRAEILNKEQTFEEIGVRAARALIGRKTS
jgi:PAS domain S-box-containing protein